MGDSSPPIFEDRWPWRVDQAVQGSVKRDTLVMLHLQLLRQLGNWFAKRVGNWSALASKFDIFLIIVVVHMVHVSFLCDLKTKVSRQVSETSDAIGVNRLETMFVFYQVFGPSSHVLTNRDFNWPPSCECHHPAHFHQSRRRNSLAWCRFYHRRLDRCVEFLVLWLLQAHVSVQLTTSTLSLSTRRQLTVKAVLGSGLLPFWSFAGTQTKHRA